MHKSSKFRLFLFFHPRVARYPPGAAEGTVRHTSFINGDRLYTNSICPFGGFGGSWTVKFYKGSVFEPSFWDDFGRRADCANF
jgi:hypothetical protein